MFFKFSGTRFYQDERDYYAINNICLSMAFSLALRFLCSLVHRVSTTSSWFVVKNERLLGYKQESTQFEMFILKIDFYSR